MKIKFNSEDSLTLNKTLKHHNMAIIVRSVFEKDGKYYPQVFFRWMFVWVIKMLQSDRIDVSEGIDINKTDASKECMFCIVGILKMVLKLNHIYVIVVTIHWWLLKYWKCLASLNLRGLYPRCVLWGIKNEAVIRWNKSVIENKGVYKRILAQIRYLLK